jgi:hypothetical protein
MGPLQPDVAGVVLLSAPAAMPEQRDVDAELVDLLCEDPEWLDATFRVSAGR